VGDARLYVIAGRRLDAAFLTSLVLPPGMRVLLYRNLEPAFSPQALAGVAAQDAAKLAPLIEQVRRENREAIGEIQWSADEAGVEAFHAIPLDDRDRRPLGVLLIGSSRRQVVALMHSIRNVGWASAPPEFFWRSLWPPGPRRA